MAQRQIQRAPVFEKDLETLSRKYRELPDTVADQLNLIARSESPLGDRIPGIGGHPVYKLRIKCGNKGKRGGARLIYYCAEGLVLALFIYAKNDLSDVPSSAISSALTAAGLIKQ